MELVKNETFYNYFLDIYSNWGFQLLFTDRRTAYVYMC